MRREISLRGWGVVPTLLIAGVCVTCKGQSGRGGPLPETFGLYYEAKNGLHEIPTNGNGAYQEALKELFTNLGTKTAPEIEKGWRTVFQTCEKAEEKPVLILYHEALKPEMLIFQKADSGKEDEVELGIAPVESRRSMYRILPKQALKDGFYMLSVKSEGATKGVDCFLVNLTVDEMVKKATQGLKK